MPEEQFGAVHCAGDGSLTLAGYAGEKSVANVSGLAGLSSSIFITRDEAFVFATSPSSHQFTIANQSQGKSIGCRVRMFIA